jgi:hypothetical protein
MGELDVDVFKNNALAIGKRNVSCLQHDFTSCKKKTATKNDIVTLPGYCYRKKVEQFGKSVENTLKSKRNEVENSSMSDFLRTWRVSVLSGMIQTAPENCPE